MKLERLHISTLLALAAAAWWMVLYINGTAVTMEHLAPFSTVVGVLVLVGIAFEKFLWRLSWLHGWFVKRPDLRGTWRVELQSSWVDPATNERVPIIVCYMAITQTFSTLQMHLMTPESESVLVAESISPAPTGNGYQVVGAYTNTPDVHLRGARSEIHFGTLVVNTHGGPGRPITMSGEYWTDRGTKGNMTFTGRVSAMYTRFQEAEDQLG